MSKKVALIIGGNGGIGCSATRQLAKDGFQVCATYNKNKVKLEKLQDEFGLTIDTYPCDISDENAVNKVVESIVVDYSNIDVVVFSVVSSFKNTKLLEAIWQQYQEHIELQIKAMINTIKAMRGQVRAKHKTSFIVLLTDACIGSPPKGFSPYVTAKYAAMGLAKTMAVELVQFDCRVNMISPGMVETDLLKDLPHKLIEMSALQNPLKRNATPEDVSNAISFLASEKSEYMNGANIVVNGGNIIL